MKRKILWTVVIVLLLATVLSTVALAVSDDPLISLSYLTGVFKKEILDEAQTQIESEIARAESSISQQLAAIDQSTSQGQSGFTGYVKYTLSAGERLQFLAGSELLVLSGSAAVESGSLTDSTEGVVVGAGGALAVNHLHIGLADGSLKAAGTVEIMICE